VHSHVKAVYRKLGVSSRAEAVARSEQVLTAHPGEIPREG
jgi:DNA-binding CsgD family transcriptional regulator